jgi:hypothetical protein
MSSGFTCTAVRDGTSIKILSVCTNCGESRVVSMTDGTLREWEQTHHCAGARKTPQPVTLPVRIRKEQ